MHRTDLPRPDGPPQRPADPEGQAPPAQPADLAARTAARLTALEEKACYADDLLDHLNRQVADQQAQISLLLRELLHLRQQTSAAQPEGFRSLRDELPPHY